MKIIILLIFISCINSFNLKQFRKNTYKKIFNKITEKLPEFHKSGDDILYKNEIIINNILKSDMKDEDKKNLIKLILDATIFFDSLAGKFLRIYRSMVDEIL